MYFKKLLAFLLALACINHNLMASDSVEKAGDILQVAIPAIGYGTTFVLDDTEGRQQIYQSAVSNFLTTYAIKIGLNKKRPNGGKHSFPSGHTSSAFQGAAFIHARYGFVYAFPAYLGAAFVGYSRVESNHHFTEDVIAGAAVGVLNSFYFTDEYNGVSITPIVQYRNTEIPKYRNTEIPKYRNTEIPKYRNTEIPKYRNTEIPKYRA